MEKSISPRRAWLRGIFIPLGILLGSLTVSYVILYLFFYFVPDWFLILMTCIGAVISGYVSRSLSREGTAPIFVACIAAGLMFAMMNMSYENLLLYSGSLFASILCGAYWAHRVHTREER